MIKPIGLYIHVPFCAKKCPYCDFYSVKYNDEVVEKYVDAVINNILIYKGKNIAINSIYFGGGTPSLLSAERLNKILCAVKESFIDKEPEVTIEVNPSLVSKDKFLALHDIGINRISFGVQSMNDNELKALGRLHNSETAKKALTNAHDAGFDNISVDLMLGIKNQTIDSLSESIEKLSKLPITHISAYILKIEKNTPFNDEKIISQLPSEDETCDLYLYCVKKLAEKDFIQYEISNFSKLGYESKHNLHYWNCEEYIGIGPSAHSYFKGKRYAVNPSIEEFTGAKIQKEIITDNNPGKFQEYAMLKIRLMSGVDLNECQKKYNVKTDIILEKAKKLQKVGLLRLNNDIISLTPEGCLVSNQIILNLFG